MKLIEPIEQERQFPIPNKMELVFLILLIAGALLLRIANISSYLVMSADGVGYAKSGKAFIHSFEFRHIGGVFPPFYQFMIGLFSLFIENLETAARSVSIFFSTLSILPLFFIVKRYFGALVAGGSTLLYVFLPFSHYMSGIDISEPTYTFMALSGLMLVVYGIDLRKYLFIFIAGVLIGFAYLTRPEALILFGGLWLFFALMLFYKNFESGVSRRMLIYFTFGWLTVAIPYMTILQSITGKWQVSGKIGIGMQLVKERYGITGSYEAGSRLDKDGKMVGDKEFDSIFSLLHNYPDIFWKNIWDNLREFPEKVALNVPYYLLLLAIIGCFRKPVYAITPGRMPLYCTFLPLASYLIFSFDPRYFYPYVPILLLFSVSGADWLSGCLTRRFLRKEMPIGIALIAILSAYYFYLDIPRVPSAPYDYTQDGGRFDDKQVGLRLKKILPSDSVLMTRSGRVAFYANMPYSIPPDSDLDASLNYARNNKITHIIANMQMYAMRPAFAALYTPLTSPGFIPSFQGLELVYTGQEPGGQPYLVYKLR